MGTGAPPSARDDERGPGIIPDYSEAHVPAAEDPFVRQTWEETRRLQAEARRLLSLLELRQQCRDGLPLTWHDLPQRPVDFPMAAAPVSGLD